MNRRTQLALAFILALTLRAAPGTLAQNAATAEKRGATSGPVVPPFDNNSPGVGPIRTEERFIKTWRDRRATFARQASKQHHALVFLGDSITQGWKDDLRGKFPGL